MFDTARLKRQTDLREVAGRFSVLHKESAKEMSGACPLCGGADRLHVTKDAFFCRNCHPKWGDALEFLTWARGVDFKTAAAMLGGDALPSGQPVASATPKTGRPVQPEDWCDDAMAAVERARRVLWSVDGGRFTDYLLGRGLDPYTWQAFGLGADFGAWSGKRNAPALMIPWVRSGRLVAVRYRFLSVEDGGRKTTSQPGSVFAGVLFGGQAMVNAGAMRNLRTVVLVEGEINAMSIWQVAHQTNVDVLSLGSETQTITEQMIDSLTAWGKVLVWMDKPEIARQAITRLAGAYGVNSLTGDDGRKLDANDLLRLGSLGGFLSAARLEAGTCNQERERLLWDLWSGANTLTGVDSGTAAILRYLSNETGKRAPIFEAEPDRWIAEID